LLKKLKLPTLEYRRARGDMIEVFKILHGFHDNTNNITLTLHVGVATRGNKYKLYQGSVKYDLEKHFFTNTVVSLWHSLPDEVADSNTINCFKDRLDKFGNNQSVIYNWDADFTGTENRSLCYQESY
jgi:ribonucleases P/MRP protein subunit RPP40